MTYYRRLSYSLHERVGCEGGVAAMPGGATTTNLPRITDPTRRTPAIARIVDEKGCTVTCIPLYARQCL